MLSSQAERDPLEGRAGAGVRPRSLGSGVRLRSLGSPQGTDALTGAVPCALKQPLGDCGEACRQPSAGLAARYAAELPLAVEPPLRQGVQCGRVLPPAPLSGRRALWALTAWSVLLRLGGVVLAFLAASSWCLGRGAVECGAVWPHAAAHCTGLLCLLAAAGCLAPVYRGARRGRLFLPRSRRRRRLLPVWPLLTLLVLTPAFTSAMPRPKRAPSVVGGAVGAASVPVPTDVQHLDSDSPSLSPGSSPACPSSSAPCTETRPSGHATDCSVNGSTPIITVVEPSTCPAHPLEAVAAAAPAHAPALADQTVGWHHLPGLDVPDPVAATVLPPLGTPGHRLAVALMPTFRPANGWIESQWLAAAREAYVPSVGSDCRTLVCSAHHRYDRATGRFVRLPVDMPRFVARAFARGVAEASAECFFQRRLQQAGARPSLPPPPGRPPPGFGDSEWAHEAAASVGEASGPVGADAGADASLLVEVAEARLQAFLAGAGSPEGDDPEWMEGDWRSRRYAEDAAASYDYFGADDDYSE